MPRSEDQNDEEARQTSQPSRNLHRLSDRAAKTPVERPSPREHKIHPTRGENASSRSSIAGNLATARGIPSLQQRAAKQALRQSQAAPSSGSPTKDRTVSASNAGRKLENLPGEGVEGHESTFAVAEDADEKPDSMAGRPGQGISVPNEDAFNRFYSTFGPLLSKLSAPLAFAGLPLQPDQDSPTTNTASSPNTASKPDTKEPDMTQLFSAPALRALLSTHGPLTPQPPPHESFYVVPTAGGTVSYADMLSRSTQHPKADSTHHPPGKNSPEQEHFVDAPSRPLGSSAASRRASAALQPRSPQTNKTMEELETENASLKMLTDGLSKRLYMWERSAQGQAEALRRSVRFLQQSPLAETGEQSEQQSLKGVEGRDEAEGGRVRELEEELRKWRRDAEKSSRENEKLRGVVGRYRERWERLKEGARVRREGEGGGATDAAGAGG